MGIISYIIILIPITAVILASWLFYKGLNNKDEIIWKYVTIGILIFVTLYILIAVFTPVLDYVMFIVFMFAAGTSVLAGFVLIFYMPGFRKLSAAAIMVLSPIIMFLSMDIGMNYTFDALTKRNGEHVIDALEKHLHDYGYYPSNLSELIPSYIDDLQEPNTVWGWLYHLEDDSYALGYVEYVDSLGYSVSVYRHDLQEWEYLSLSTGPFELGPTPMP